MLTASFLYEQWLKVTFNKLFVIHFLSMEILIEYCTEIFDDIMEEMYTLCNFNSFEYFNKAYYIKYYILACQETNEWNWNWPSLTITHPAVTVQWEEVWWVITAEAQLLLQCWFIFDTPSQVVVNRDCEKREANSCTCIYNVLENVCHWKNINCKIYNKIFYIVTFLFVII